MGKNEDHFVALPKPGVDFVRCTRPHRTRADPKARSWTASFEHSIDSNGRNHGRCLTRPDVRLVQGVGKLPRLDFLYLANNDKRTTGDLPVHAA